MPSRLLSVAAAISVAFAVFAAALVSQPRSARAIGAFDVSDVIVSPTLVQFRVANPDRSNDGNNGGYDGVIVWAVISCQDAPDAADGDVGDGSYLITPSLPPTSDVGAVQYNVGNLVTFVPRASTRWPVLWDGTPYHDCRAFIYSNLVSDGAANDYASRQSFAIPVNGGLASPPVVTVPSALIVEATGPNGAPVTYSASATDSAGGALTPSCDPASGAVFPLGTTTVNCSATDTAGLIGTASFDVTVVDTTPPVLTLPTNVIQDVLGPASNAAISYAVSATDLVDGALTPVCTPNLGTIVPLGTTTVSCTATDAHGNPTSGTFTVTANTLPPTNKSQCENGGWQGFNNPAYKNQGQCIKSMNGK